MFDFLLFASDGQFFLLFLGIILAAFLVQSWVRGSYRKYAEVANGNGYTGAETARHMLNDNGLYDVQVEVGGGMLGDYYDPRSKIIRLSHDVYYGRSVTSSAIATHEVGHAIQHQQGYGLLVVRNQLLPVTSIANQSYFILIFLGIFLYSNFLLALGITLFAMVALFQLITLPVEFDASHRAYTYIQATQGTPIAAQSNKVLIPAAMTYVVALLTSLLYLLRYLSIFTNRRR